MSSAELRLASAPERSWPARRPGCRAPRRRSPSGSRSRRAHDRRGRPGRRGVGLPGGRRRRVSPRGRATDDRGGEQQERDGQHRQLPGPVDPAATANAAQPASAPATARAPPRPSATARRVPSTNGLATTARISTRPTMPELGERLQVERVGVADERRAGCPRGPRRTRRCRGRCRSAARSRWRRPPSPRTGSARCPRRCRSARRRPLGTAGLLELLPGVGDRAREARPRARRRRRPRRPRRGCAPRRPAGHRDAGPTPWRSARASAVVSRPTPAQTTSVIASISSPWVAAAAPGGRRRARRAGSRRRSGSRCPAAAGTP